MPGYRAGQGPQRQCAAQPGGMAHGGSVTGAVAYMTLKILPAGWQDRHSLLASADVLSL